MTPPRQEFAAHALSEAQALSDLEWTISSPSLVSDPRAVESGSLRLETIDPAHLLRFLSERTSHRVGRYFESLVAYWLTHVERFDVIGHGIQLREGKRTVGEIDFLFRDHAGALNHWEAAVKFFLHFPSSAMSHYPGPNATDNFELKTEKLFEKQLRVSETYYPEVEIRKAFVRGSIFYSANCDMPEATPTRLAREHHRGRWLRQAEIGALEALEARFGFICPKPFWLSPLVGPKTKDVESLAAELKIHFEKFDHPVMVCLLDQDSGLETQRLFVVSDRWPLAAT